MKELTNMGIGTKINRADPVLIQEIRSFEHEYCSGTFQLCIFFTTANCLHLERRTNTGTWIHLNFQLIMITRPDCHSWKSTIDLAKMFKEALSTKKLKPKISNTMNSKITSTELSKSTKNI